MIETREPTESLRARLADGAAHPGYVAGRYYGGEWATLTTSVMAAGRLYASLFRVVRPVTVDRLKISVTAAAAAGTVVRLGVYRVTDGLPAGAALVDGTAAADAVGAPEISFAAAALEAGFYALCAVSNGTPTVRAGNGGNGAFWAVGHGDTAPPAPYGFSVDGVSATAALPSSPAFGIGSGAQPYLSLRKA